MIVYVLRYASDGETSHINEAFTSVTEARKRFKELKQEAERDYQLYNESGTIYETPPIEMFDGPIEHYITKYTVKTVGDLVELINRL